MPRETGRKVIAQNRRARHDYAIIDTFEAGMVLTGTEVKSLRPGARRSSTRTPRIGTASVAARVHIPEYTQGTWTNHPPRRNRKLLLNRARSRS